MGTCRRIGSSVNPPSPSEGRTPCAPMVVATPVSGMRTRMRERKPAAARPPSLVRGVARSELDAAVNIPLRKIHARDDAHFVAVLQVAADARQRDTLRNVVRTEHLAQERLGWMDQVVAEHDRERLIADVRLRHRDRVSEPERLLLADVMDLRHIRDLRKLVVGARKVLEGLLRVRHGYSCQIR